MPKLKTHKGTAKVVTKRNISRTKTLRDDGGGVYGMTVVKRKAVAVRNK